MPNNLILMVTLPIVIAVLNTFLPTILKKVLTFLGLGYLLYLCYDLFTGAAEAVYLFGQPILGMDKMALFALIFIQVMSFIILIFSLKGVDKGIERGFFILYPMTVGISNGIVLSVNTFGLLIFWGLSGLMLYLFGLLGQTSSAPQTAKKTFIIVGGSDVFLILGLILIWFLGANNSWGLWNTQVVLSGGLAYVAFFSILIAAFAKAGGFPFHTWLPDFSQDAPLESVAFLPASLDKLVGIYLLARLSVSLFVVNLNIQMILISLGALTVICAVMMALIQHNGRRLLGYHAVSQVGYMIVGIGSGNPLALIGGFFHLINNTVYKTGLFLTLGSVEKRTGTNNLDELGGLGRNMPLTFIAALTGALAISGIPPLNGFYSKWLIYQGLIEKMQNLTAGYQIWLLVCLILAVFGSALTLASFMKFIHAIFLGKRPKKWKDVKEAPFNQWFSVGVLALLCVVFGLFAKPLPIGKFIAPIISELGLPTPVVLGSYEPVQLFLLFGTAFLLGLVIYLLVKNVRFDENYLGGMPSLEKFRIAGTEFYNEIRNISPLKSIYNAAEKKHFDVYDLGVRGSLSFSGLLKRLHSGQLLNYNLWIIIGMLILLWVVW